VRGYRDSGEYDQAPTLRACLMIARVTALQDLQPSAQDGRFLRVCLDILESKVVLSSQVRQRLAQQQELLRSLIERHCA